MLEFDTALDLMKKYGYSSTSVHPYIYQSGDNVGICYTYNDEEYGTLERIKIFDDSESFEQFLAESAWLKSNAKNYNVRMTLDNYESINPKVLYLRNEKLMIEGEMFDIENFDYRDSQRKQMDEVSKILYEAGDIFLVYDEIKERQLQYFKKLIELKNSLRQKYFDLQKEVDSYNNVKVERHLTLLPEVIDKGNINEALEITLKDRYNMYISQRPSLEEISGFVREVWDLAYGLESNAKYYEAQKEENDIRNELKAVEQKLEVMYELNENLRSLFGIDIVSKFQKINADVKKESNYISDGYVADRLAIISKKYEVFDKLDLLYTSDYLREAIQNTNYADLAVKYAKGVTEDTVNRVKLPINEVAADLNVQYKEKLSVTEQSILVLYNNHKFRKLFNAILEIDNFETLPIKSITKKISNIKDFSKLKTECYDSVRRRINDPVNETVKSSLFYDIDFTSFDTFIASLIKKISVLKNVNNKMVINSDVYMYFVVKDSSEVTKRKYALVTKDLNSLLAEVKDSKSLIALVLLKEKTPVLYSPYYFDMGDIYSKGASPLMEIKEISSFDVLVELADVSINIDDINMKVARYHTEPKLVDNISYVDDIKLSYITEFCKLSFVNNLPAEAVDSSVQATTENDFGSGIVAAPVAQTPTAEVQNNPVMDQPSVEVQTAPVVEAVQPQESTFTSMVDASVKEEPIKEEVKEEVPTEVKEETKNEASEFVSLTDDKKEPVVEVEEPKSEVALQPQVSSFTSISDVKQESKEKVEEPKEEAKTVFVQNKESINSTENVKEQPKPVEKEIVQSKEIQTQTKNETTTAKPMNSVPAAQTKPVQSKTTEVKSSQEKVTQPVATKVEGQKVQPKVVASKPVVQKQQLEKKEATVSKTSPAQAKPMQPVSSAQPKVVKSEEKPGTANVTNATATQVKNTTEAKADKPVSNQVNQPNGKE